MASAKRVSAVPVPPPPPEVIVLTLSMEEAETLHLVVGQVAGSYAGRRGHASAIFSALANAGVNLDLENRPSGSLEF